MKIIFNILGIDPPFNTQHGGAIGKLVSYQMDYLKDRGHKIIAFVDNESNFTKEGIDVIYYRGEIGSSNLIGFFTSCFFQFMKICKLDADIIISTHPDNVASSFLYSRLKNKKWIVWELDHTFWIGSITLVKWFYRNLFRFSKKIFTISSQQRKWILGKIGCHNKMELVYDCIDSDKFSPLENYNHCEKYILYVAKFTKRKNHLALIKAFEKIITSGKFPDLRLFLIGSKSGAFTQREKRKESLYYLQCQSYVIDRDLSNRVVFFDVINENELINLYRRSILFIMPSLEEGFGLALLEAMSCGCACIASNIEPISEVLGEAGLLFDPLNIEELTKSIQFLLDDDEERDRMRILARQRVLSMFSYKKIRKIFEDLILEI